MLRKPPPDSSNETSIDRRLTIAMYGCSVAAALGLLSLSLGRSGGWATAWIPLGTGFCLALTGAGAWLLRARHRRPSAQPHKPPFPDVSFAHPEVWREIDSNRDLLYALLELSRRRMRDTLSRPHASISGVGVNPSTFTDERLK